MGMFAFACALLVPPPVLVDDADDAIDDETDDAPARRSARAPATREPAYAEPSPGKPRERWGEDVKWPDEWR